MNLYEHTIVARQDTSPAQVKQLAEKYSKIMQKNDGEIVQTEDWGLLNLAYDIKKNKKGIYMHFKIKLDNENPSVSSASLNKFLTMLYLSYKSLPIPTNCEP